jgi:hypothetical protein
MGEDRVSGQRGWVAIGVVILLAAFVLQLALQARRESQTWDEGRHTFAGKLLDARRFRRKPKRLDSVCPGATGEQVTQLPAARAATALARLRQAIRSARRPWDPRGWRAWREDR